VIVMTASRARMLGSFSHPFKPRRDVTRWRRHAEARDVEREVRSEMADRLLMAREAMEHGRALREGKPVTFRRRRWP